MVPGSTRARLFAGVPPRDPAADAAEYPSWLPAGDQALRTMVATSPGALRHSGLDLAFSGEARWADRSMTPSRKERSPTPTPRGGAAGSSTDRTDHSAAFGDGHDTMESIIEETLNVVPGIDDDPDDATPWAANLTFPDLMDLARTIKRDLNMTQVMRIGGVGPVHGQQRQDRTPQRAVLVAAPLPRPAAPVHL